jgi:broad specificity phosphatase PhoE
MLEIFLVWHGECKGNRENLFRGRHDFPLNSNGVVQAHCLKDKLQKITFDAFISSPLKRSSQTADIISAGKAGVTIEDRFTSTCLGEWESKPKEYVREKFPYLWQPWKTEPEKSNVPGMETLAEVQKRSFDALQSIIQKYERRRVAIVIHSAVLKPLIAAILNIPEPYFWKIHMDTAAYSSVEYRKDRGFTFTLLNETDHLNDFIREDIA